MMPRTRSTVGLFGALTLLLPLAFTGCIGPPVQVVPNEYSRNVSTEAIDADLAHCEEIATEVLHGDYGPTLTMENPFADAAKLRGYRTRVEGACMRAKGYEVKSSLGMEIQPIDLPASAVSKARGETAE